MSTTHDSMISDRFLVPEIEIEIRQMPFDGHARAPAAACTIGRIFRV